MCMYPWRRRSTRHFGDQWVPFAELNLQSTRGRWYTFSVQVDTGAVISVLPRSAADLLGVRWEGGVHIDLAGVGGPSHEYVVHSLNARIGGLAEFDLRVAVARREDVPSLLGRLDVIDRFSLELHAASKETRFLDVPGQVATAERT